MIEIKFRCWNKNLKKMQFFDGIFNSAPYTEKSNFSQYESCPEYHELILMQYIGLKDKNDIEIYTDDLLKVPNDFIKEFMGHKISYSVLTIKLLNGKFCAVNNNNEIPYDCNLNIYNNSKKIEVIGNIHENHELLDNK